MGASSSSENDSKMKFDCRSQRGGGKRQSLIHAILRFYLHLSETDNSPIKYILKYSGTASYL